MNDRRAAESRRKAVAKMLSLTPGAQIDELEDVLRISEQHRQAAEMKLADCERRLGTACRTIAAQDHRIGWLTAELSRLRAANPSAPPLFDDYDLDARRFLYIYGP
jgi:hypothetical protein